VADLFDEFMKELRRRQAAAEGRPAPDDVPGDGDDDPSGEEPPTGDDAPTGDADDTGEPGDGIVAVIPIEKFFLIRTRSEATAAEFWPKHAP
jgi:hypothetical protein